MSIQLKSIVLRVRDILLTAKCSHYSDSDRHSLLAYRTSSLPLPFHVSQALKHHCQSTPNRCLTRLAEPVVVFCEDDLEGSVVEGRLDLWVTTRLNLGRSITTYEELVQWYLAHSYTL
jgi:hypothetical protein